MSLKVEDRGEDDRDGRLPSTTLTVSRTLRDDRLPCKFEQLIDLCGVDYSSSLQGPSSRDGLRFAVVSHLLSVTHNWRLR